MTQARNTAQPAAGSAQGPSAETEAARARAAVQAGNEGAEDQLASVAAQVQQRTAGTHEEALEQGFFGVVNSLPNTLHHVTNEAQRAETFGANPTAAVPETTTRRSTARGAQVNTDDSPEPSGGTSGPGAGQDADAGTRNNP